MKRVQRLSTLWNWLPAFRAVAETEHLPTASDALNVSASALSRSIRLLEDDVGQPLFDRLGRNIHLNAAGKKLLFAVRNAMRLVDEGLQGVSSGQLVGPVHISIPGPFAPVFVLPALRGLAEAHPELVPYLQSQASGTVAQMLLRGAVDVALLDDPLENEGLSTEALFDIEHSIYAAPNHPATMLDNLSPDDLAEFPFVAPIELPSGLTPDAWPVHRSRHVGLRVTQMQVAVEAVRRGDYLGAFPKLIGRQAGLVELPCLKLPSSTLYLVQRPALGVGGRTDAVVAALRRVAEEMKLEPSQDDD